MDINEEASLAHKRTFMDFLDQDVNFFFSLFSFYLISLLKDLPVKCTMVEAINAWHSLLTFLWQHFVGGARCVHGQDQRHDHSGSPSPAYRHGWSKEFQPWFSSQGDKESQWVHSALIWCTGGGDKKCGSQVSAGRPTNSSWFWRSFWLSQAYSSGAPFSISWHHG